MEVYSQYAGEFMSSGTGIDSKTERAGVEYIKAFNLMPLS